MTKIKNILATKIIVLNSTLSLLCFGHNIESGAALAAPAAPPPTALFTELWTVVSNIQQNILMCLGYS